MARKITGALPEKLKFRWKEPTVDTRANSAGGLRDEVAEKLAEVAEKFDDAPDDEWRADLLPLVHAAHTSLEKARRRVWTMLDTTDRAMASAQSVLGGEQDEAARAVPQLGWPSADDYARATQSARAKVMTRALGSIKASTLEQTREERAAIEQAAQDACSALATGIDSAHALATAPKGITQSTTLEDLQRVASVERDIRARPKPAAYSFALWSGFVQRGQLAEAERIADGAKSLMIEIRDSTPAKLSARYDQLRAGTVDEERQLAFRFLQALERYDAEKIRDSSIAVANEAAGLLAEVFSTLLGTNPKYLSRSAFDSLFLRVDSGKNDAAAPWQSRATRGPASSQARRSSCRVGARLRCGRRTAPSSASRRGADQWTAKPSAWSPTSLPTPSRPASRPSTSTAA